MSLATIAQKQAASALKKFGAKATLTHTTAGAYDPATGTTANTSTVTPCSALLDSSSLKTLGFKFNPALIQAGDMMASIVVPVVAGDVLTIASGPYAGPYKVRDVRPEFVGDAVVMSQCLVGR